MISDDWFAKCFRTCQTPKLLERAQEGYVSKGRGFLLILWPQARWLHLESCFESLSEINKRMEYCSASAANSLPCSDVMEMVSEYDPLRSFVVVVGISLGGKSRHEMTFQCCIVVLDSVNTETQSTETSWSDAKIMSAVGGSLLTPSREVDLKEEMEVVMNKLETQYVFESDPTKCGWCFKKRSEVSKGKVCSGCRVAFYCCEDCFRLDWKKRHRKACPRMDQWEKSSTTHLDKTLV